MEAEAEAAVRETEAVIAEQMGRLASLGGGSVALAFVLDGELV